MARIFLGLSLFALSLLAANILMGLWIGDFHGVSAQQVAAQERLSKLEKSSRTPPDDLAAAVAEFKTVSAEFQTMKQRKVLHFLFGVAAALVAVLVNSVSVTYFIGTSRWCREVVDVYQLSDQYVERSNRIKRGTFPWSLGGIGIILAIIMLGAAADPSANLGGAPTWVTAHFLAALAGTFLLGVSFLMQVGKIGANYDVIDEILADVARIRQERGLDIEESQIPNLKSEI